MPSAAVRPVHGFRRLAAPAFGRSGNERVCPADVRDSHLLLVRLVEVEPPNTHVNEVVRDTFLEAEERLELPHVDICGTMQQGGHSEAPVGVEVLEVPPQGVCQGVRGRVLIEVIGLPVFRLDKGARVPRLWHSGGGGGHGVPVRAAIGPGGEVLSEMLSFCAVVVSP